jgi:hypothetical protein
MYDNHRAREWYMTNPSYESVFYDNYKKLYYRIARLPLKEYIPSDQNRKPKIIIVLDSNLNYLGEVSLPKDVKLEMFNCFISEDGINIQLLNDDEDNLTYHQYRIKYEH